MSKDYELDEKTRRKLEDDTGKINKWLKDLNITKELLDNERCPLKSSSFLKNFRQKYTSLPLVVVIFFLIISVSIFNLNYLALKIWLSFYGSIIAGFLTLFGVALTIIYNKEQIIYDNKNRDIKREIETISTMLAETDYSFCYYVFNTFKSLKITNGTLNETLVYDLKKELEKRYSFLYKSSAFLSAYSKIVNIPLECENYKNTCTTYKIKKEFLKIHVHVKCTLKEYFDLIYNYIDSTNSYYASLMSTNFESVPVSHFRSKLDELEEKINKKFYDIEELHFNTSQLITLLRYYEYSLISKNNKHFKFF